MGDQPSGRCTTGPFLQTSGNRVAMWRARRKAKESEEAKQVRLNKECHEKSVQRQKQYHNESLNESLFRREQ